jgi:hypothetical protein
MSSVVAEMMTFELGHGDVEGGEELGGLIDVVQMGPAGDDGLVADVDADEEEEEGLAMIEDAGEFRVEGDGFHGSSGVRLRF